MRSVERVSAAGEDIDRARDPLLLIRRSLGDSVAGEVYEPAYRLGQEFTCREWGICDLDHTTVKKNLLIVDTYEYENTLPSPTKM